MKDVYFRVAALSKTVHPAQALRDAVECGQVANEMVGRDIHPNFAGAGADEVDGLLCRLGPGQEATEDRSFNERITLQSAQCAGELPGLILRKFFCDLLNVFDLAGENQHRSPGALKP